MDVVAERGHSVYGLDNVTGKVPRVTCGKTHAPDALDLADRRQQFREASLPFRVVIAVHVLAQELNLGKALIGDAPRFGQHRIRPTAALFASGIRHYAVGAEFVAAFDDGDVTAIRVLTSGEFGFEGLVGLAVIESGDASLAGFQAREHFGQLAV